MQHPQTQELFKKMTALEKRFYNCKFCAHNWDEVTEINLDSNNRPKANIIRTKVKPPNNLNY